MHEQLRGTSDHACGEAFALPTDVITSGVTGNIRGRPGIDTVDARVYVPSDAQKIDLCPRASGDLRAGTLRGPLRNSDAPAFAGISAIEIERLTCPRLSGD